jgi:beta-lactamase regulating signal transducer with metallopeptidase domain
MTPEFLTAPISQAIGWALLHLIWQGAIVAGILAAALALLRQKSANTRYAFACAALALLPLLAVVTAWRCYEPLPMPSDGPISLRASSLPADVAKAVAVQAAKTMVVSAGDLARSALPYVVLTWLAGVTILSIRLFVGLSRVQRLAARAVPASVEWESTLRRLSHALGLRYAVALLETASAEVPTVVGWLRPVILLPASALSGLSAEQIEMLLAHELAHIRRNDFFINVLQSVVETLMFYHPAAWWISSRIRVEREHCCDDLAVEVCGNPVQYARALTRLEELRSTRSGLAVAANGGSLVGRIRRLVGAPIDATASASRWFAALGVLAIVAVVLSVPTLPARADREQPQPAKPSTPAAVPPAPAQPKAAHSTIDVTPQPAQPDDADTADDPDDGPPDVVVTPAVSPRVPVQVTAPVARSGVVVATPAVAPIARAMALVTPTPDVSATFAVAPEIAEAVRGGVEGALAGQKHLNRRTFGASGKLTVDELIELRNAGVTPEFIAEIRGAGLNDLTLGDIVMLAMQGVRASYIKDLRAAGVEINTAADALGLRMMNVTTKYVQQMSDAGFRNLTRRDLMELRAAGVTPAFIKAIGDAGYKDLSARDLIRLASHGVSPEFIKEMSQYRDRK